VYGLTIGTAPAVKCLNGEAGRRWRDTVIWAGGVARFGELFLSVIFRSEGSKTVIRTGDVGGKASSAIFRGTRTLLGELGDREGLSDRSWGEYRIWPAPLTPGSDCVRDKGRAKEAADRDLE
jgi:hypothetical protein